MTLDWKNEEDYAYCNDLDANGWAFEFLRRNPGYQKDWADFSRRKEALELKYGKVDPKNRECFQDPFSHVYEPERREDETPEEWLNRVHPEAKEVKKIWFEDYYQEKWCLKNQFPDPNKTPKASPEFNVLRSYPIFPDYEQVSGYFESGDDDPPKGLWQKLPEGGVNALPLSKLLDIKFKGQKPGEGVVVFDLTMPLEHQFNMAKEQLQKRAVEEERKGFIIRLKNKAPGYIKTLFKMYLRALDGKASGASNKEIGEVFFGNYSTDSTKATNQSKKAYDLLRQAKPYINYRFLAIARMDFNSGR